MDGNFFTKNELQYDDSLITQKSVAIILLLCIPVQAILAYLLGEISKSSRDVQILLSYFASQAGFIISIALFYRGKTKNAFALLPLKPKINPIAGIFAIGVALGLIAQNMIISYSFDWFLQGVNIVYSIEMPNLANPVVEIFSIIVICALPAICEEIIFRGFLLKALRKSGNTIAAVVTSLIFAIFHLNLNQLLHQFIISFFLCNIVILTNKLIYGQIIHFFNNLVAILLATHVPSYANLGAPNWSNALVLGIIAICGVCILYPSLAGLLKNSVTTVSAKKIGNFLFAGLDKEERKQAQIIDKEKRVYSNGRAYLLHPWVYVLIGLLVFLLIVLAVVAGMTS
ncbi:MAG: CPBP family intramembrane metalloprotease [Christensenellaceae bacterium]|jgi:membrane protease YdiL (CAAX protease family)|nr:CPBP family intramembrane metalloprotease [Christensenellaceae bacterium]